MARIVNKIIRGNLEYVWVENVSEMTKYDIAKRYGVDVIDVKKITRDTATFTRPITTKSVSVTKYQRGKSIVTQHRRTKPKRK